MEAMAMNRSPVGDAGRNKCSRSSAWLTRVLGFCGDCPLLTSALGDSFKNTSSSPAQRSLVLFFYFLDCTGRNIGQVCFCNNPIAGYFILAGLAIGMPLTAAGCFVCSSVGILFALAMKQRVPSLTAGLCCYNAALLGAVMPALLLGPGSAMGAGAVWLSMILGAICTVLISNSLGNSFGSLKPAMPIFTLPFNLVALFSYVCLLVWQPPGPANNSTPPPEISGLKVLQGGFLGAGQVFAVEDWWCSSLVLVGMFVSSPILSLAGFLGSLIATCFAVMVSPTLYAAAYSGIYGYNGFLAACSVGYFFVPCWRSIVVATCNATLATAVQVALAFAFSGAAVPVFTLPFVGASLLILGLTAEGEALPRPCDLTYPEQHLVRWNRRVIHRECEVTDHLPL